MYVCIISLSLSIYIYICMVMDKLPSTIIQHMYEYATTYNNKFDKVSKQLSAHCFIHICHSCFKPWNNCYCYCEVCRTYLKLCHQIYYDKKVPMKMS